MELFRCRGGRPGTWDVVWRDETRDLALAAPLRDRPAAPAHFRAGQADPPKRGPLATTLEVRGRLVLAGLDAAAGAAGLYPGLPLADARAILPGLKIVTGDPPGETAALARLAGWCGRYSPWTTPETPPPEAIDGAGGLWLDVSGCAHLFGGEAALLEDVTTRLGAAGYTARAGLGGRPVSTG